MQTTTYKIEYRNAKNILVTENRTHTTGVKPSVAMMRNALHSVCLNNGITSFENANARLYENGLYLGSVRIVK